MTNNKIFISLEDSIPLSSVPLLSEDIFRKTALDAVAAGCRISSFFGAKREDGYRLYLILTNNSAGTVSVLAMSPGCSSYQSLTAESPAFHLFEREIHEQTGIIPEGHPWLKPVRFPCARSSDTGFFSVAGSEIHQVAVGPVHAGIIEPGHFRFQCHGETIYHLETAHGYQHRGVEELIETGPGPATLPSAEVIAGDSTIAHSTSYCRVIEALTSCQVPLRAEALRTIALELERCANHIGDIGALAGDIGYLPTASFCGRIRGDFLNMSALICGNRFGRGIIRPGGVGYDIDNDIRIELLSRIDTGKKDFDSAASLLWNNPSVLARFESTGRLSREQATAIGLVGPAARACGCRIDIRRDHPSGMYKRSSPGLSLSERGDVFGRAYVRWLEVHESVKTVEKLLRELPEDETINSPATGFSPNSIAVSLTEGWRGEVCHTAITDEQGSFSRYKIVDPSFHNWFGLSLAMRDGQISDFPVCNKSFNLSYCGFDL